MRVAYVAYDRNVLKAVPALAKSFSVIDAYLLNPDQSFPDLDFSRLPVLAENVRIPAAPGERTEKQSQVLASIEEEYAALKKNIYGGEVPADLSTEAAGAAPTLHELKDVQQISLNRARKPQFLTAKSPVPQEYDFLIIQEHRLVAEYLRGKADRILKKVGAGADFAMVTLVFAFSPKVPVAPLPMDCVLVGSTAVKSIFDNWYVCSVSGSEISASFWVPEKALRTQGHEEFTARRIRDLIGSAFPEFTTGDLLSSRPHAGNGFGKTDLGLVNPRFTAGFPGFNYWSEAQASEYIHKFLTAKKIAKDTP